MISKKITTSPVGTLEHLAESQGISLFPPTDIDIMYTGNAFEFHFHDVEWESRLDQFQWDGDTFRIRLDHPFDLPEDQSLWIRSPINCPRQGFAVVEFIIPHDQLGEDHWVSFKVLQKNKWHLLRSNQYPPIAQAVPFVV